ncbi:MAG TPA: thiamine phosphate synthase [Solirubrobacteraceae bacterium]|jgi:thiamine-phosphate pyrophosphorylase|nr:thiamine phosphate synthase [Solirubrobacteraceae bacterium]
MTKPDLGCRRLQTPASGGSPTFGRRQARLAQAHLYLVCDAQPGGRELAAVLRAAIAGGVDVVQLRDKRLGDDELIAVARAARALCAQLGALFIVNDRPEVALAAGADGVHVGQDDTPVAEVRRLVGPEMLIGLSTHTPAAVDAAGPELVAYIGVGPVHATPTKPGRHAVGLELVAYAAAHARVPFFAIGGIDERTLPAVVGAGARRVAAVRAIADAPDPERAARTLRAQLQASPAQPPGDSHPLESRKDARSPGAQPDARPKRAARDERLLAETGMLAEGECPSASVALTPLAEGERPTTLMVAVALAALLAAGVLVGALTIHNLRSRGGSVPGGIFIALVLTALAVGMYRRRYWAVLGFEALLAFQITLSSLALVTATSLLTVAVCLLSITLGGWLFWKLVRVMGRLQAQERPTVGEDRPPPGTANRLAESRPDSGERLR